MAFSGINFRATSGYVTDGSGDTYSTPTFAADAYPTTRGGKTFGQAALNDFDCRNRVDTNDPRLAGMAFTAATDKVFKFDLPSGAGTYDVRIAFGDGTSGVSHNVLIKDGPTPLATISGTTGTNEFLDAAGTVRTAAAWPGSNTTQSLVFTGSQLTLVSGSGGFRVAHIAVQLAGAAPTLAGNVTIDDTAPAGGLVSVSSSLTGSVTLDDTAPAGTLGAVPGTFRSEALKDGAGSVQASTAMAWFRLYNPSTGALVVEKTGLSTNGAGVVSFSDGAVSAGVSYASDWLTAGGARRMPVKAAT